MTTTFTHSLSSTALASAITHTITMSDADFQTLLNFLIVRYTKLGPGSVTPTPAQAIQMWLQDSFSQTLAEEARYRQQQQPAIAPLAMTLT